MTRRAASWPADAGRPSLFGLSPGGVYLAADVTTDAVRSYIKGRKAPHLFTLTCVPAKAKTIGGVFSVALSLGLLPVGVTHHPAL